jgi:DNA-3-methyladenine glycosylase
LPENFFKRSTIDVAQALLGSVLWSEIDGIRCGGIIVETEAYPAGDPASHAFGGRTARNGSMFGAPGTAYVYRIYGLHSCFNVVTGAEGVGEAVLLRALVPLTNLSAMRARRHDPLESKLCTGPGNLCAALGITTHLDGSSLDRPPVWLVPYQNENPVGPRFGTTIVCGPRVGIRKAVGDPLRFQLV